MDDIELIRKTVFMFAEHDHVWEYYSGKSLHFEMNPEAEIHLVHYGQMRDPIAMFRPQTIHGYFGYAKIKDKQYEILLIFGTDEGLDEDYAELIIGTREEIHKAIQVSHLQQVYLVIPPRYKVKAFYKIEDEIKELEEAQKCQKATQAT